MTENVQPRVLATLDDEQVWYIYRKATTVVPDCSGKQFAIALTRKLIEFYETHRSLAHIAFHPQASAAGRVVDEVPSAIAFIEQVDTRLEGAGYSHAERLEIIGILMSNNVDRQSVSGGRVPQRIEKGIPNGQ